MEITREHWREYRRTKDSRLRDLLVTANISLVRQVAGRLSLQLPSCVEVGELESAGAIGLLSAVEHYDPEQSAEFATYAQHRIRGAILDDLRSQDFAPRSLRMKARKIEQTLSQLEATLGREPTDSEVASALGIERDAYWRQLGEIRGMVLVSLDEPGTEADGSESNRLMRELPDPTPRDPFIAAASKERVRLLGEIIEGLPTQERMVLTLYYVEELTMKEIGRVLDVSESRVSQIHTSAILRMRARLLRAKLQRDDLITEESAAFTLRELVLAIFLSLGLLVGGCATPAGRPPLQPVVIPREGRTVVVPALAPTEDRPLVEAIARLFVLELSHSGIDVRGPDWLQEEARARGWDTSLSSIGEGVFLRDGEAKLPVLDWDALGVRRALVVNLYGVDQHWDGTTRVTRVGVEARLIALPSGVQLWAGKIAPGSAGTAGWSFEYATRIAVRKLAESLQ